jgi:cbb3-type cytochrome oxidase maturation protein
VDVVILLVFISLMLVAAGLLFFVYRLREGDFEHADRLALTPLTDDETEDMESPKNGRSEGGRQHVKS